MARAAGQQGNNRVEGLDPQRIIVGLPAVEYRNQPVGVVRTWHLLARRRMFPGGMRQQEVDSRRVQFDQRFVDGYWIIRDVNHAEQPGEQVPETIAGQKAYAPDHLFVAATAVAVLAMAVVRDSISVERDADADIVLVEKLAKLFGQANTVGLQPEVQSAEARKPGLKFIDDATQADYADKKRLPAVKDYFNAAQVVGLDMFSDAEGRLEITSLLATTGRSRQL